MTINRLLNLPWRLSRDQLYWLRNRTKDRRPEVRALAQHVYEMHFPPREMFVDEDDGEDEELDFLDDLLDEELE